MPKPAKKPRETSIQTKCLEALERAGVWAIRVNSGLAKGLYGGIIHLAPKGTPDLLVLSPYLWAEIKRPGKRPSDEQLVWHAKAEQLGVPVVVVSSPEELLVEIEKRRAAA